MPERKDLEIMKKSELLVLARKLGIKGFSRLTKSQLIDRILSFAREKGEEIHSRVRDFIENAKEFPPIKTRKTGILKALGMDTDASDGEKPETSDSYAADTAPRKAASPSAAVGGPAEAASDGISSGAGTSDKDSHENVHVSRTGEHDPASPADPEAQARQDMSARRYQELPIMFRAQILTPEQLRDVDRDLPPLPQTYGTPRVMLMPRDPRWMLVYWDIPQEVRDGAGRASGGRLTIRLHDVTGIHFDGANSWAVYTYEVNEIAGWWYLPVPSEGRTFLAEMGYSMPDGSWRFIARSREVVPPPGTPSTWVHDVFITLPFDEPLPYEMGRHIRWLGETLPARHNAPEDVLRATSREPAAFAPRLGAVIGNGATSPGVSSTVVFGEDGSTVSLPLAVDASVRITGATEPGADLIVDGRRVEVSEDGTFSLEVPMPEGSSVHVITAQSGGHTRTVTLTFYRNTAREEIGS